MKETPIIGAALGGVSLDVQRSDGSTEQVLIRDLPMKVLPDYWSRIEDESGTVELFCDKPPGWAEGLTRESFERVLAVGEERNLDFLLRYSRRASERREMIMPGLQENFINALARQLAAGQASSPGE